MVGESDMAPTERTRSASRTAQSVNKPEFGSDVAGKRIAQILFCDDAYQIAHSRQVERYAASFGLQVTTWQGDLKPDLQNEQILRAADEGFDAIMLQPVDPTTVGDAIRRAIDSGVKVTAWAVRPADAVNIPYLDLNEYPLTFTAGQHAALAAAEFFPDQPVAALVVDVPSLPLCADYRMQGFVDGLLEIEPNAEILRIGVDSPELELVARAVRDILEKGASFNVFTACNGPMLVGGLEALGAVGRAQAIGKRPLTEYVFSLGIEGNEGLRSQVSPVMEVEALTPKENAMAYVDVVIRSLHGLVDDSYTDSIAGGVLLQPDSNVDDFMSDQYFQEEGHGSQR